MSINAARVAVLVAVGAVVVAGSALGAPAPAQAHNYLVSSVPAAGETLTELPGQFEITTNGPLLKLGGGVGGFALEVRDAAGTYYGDGCVTVEGPTMSETAALGAPGEYTVLWQLVSADGHSVSGEYSFTWAPSGEQAASAGSPNAPNAPNAPNCGGASSTAAPSTAGPETHANADLGDVLWIGGAIGAVLVAGLATVFVVSRRRKPST